MGARAFENTGDTGPSIPLEPFEDLPTSEFVVDRSGNWVDVRAPIREEPSHVRRKGASQAHATEAHPPTSIADRGRLRALLVTIAFLAFVAGIAVTAWSLLSPSHTLRLEQREVWIDPFASWTLPEYGAAHQGEPSEAAQQQPQRVVLKPVVIRASLPRIFGLLPQAQTKPFQSQLDEVQQPTPTPTEWLTAPHADEVPTAEPDL